MLLKHHLKALKLPTTTAGCEEVAARRAQENVDHPGSLLPLCELEWLGRERRAAQRRPEAARPPSPRALGSFDFAAAPSVNEPQVLEPARCEYLDRREDVLPIGAGGTGKAHLAPAPAPAREACGRGKRVRSYRVTGLAALLLEAREERRLARMRSQLAKPDPLVPDELGYVPASQVGAELPFDVIRTADERSRAIVPTNLPSEGGKEVLGSERLTGATPDRLTHRCPVLEAGRESDRPRGPGDGGAARRPRAARRPSTRSGSKGNWKRPGATSFDRPAPRFSADRHS